MFVEKDSIIVLCEEFHARFKLSIRWSGWHWVRKALIEFATQVEEEKASNGSLQDDHETGLKFYRYFSLNNNNNLVYCLIV